MPRERTFLAVKPDGVQRGHVGEIIARFEKKGFKLVGLKMMVPPMELLEQHYAEHKGKKFYPSLTGFMSSSAVVAMVWEGNNVVAIARKMTVRDFEEYIAQVKRPRKSPHFKMVVRDHRLFVNAVLNTVKDLKSAGVAASAKVVEREDTVDVVVTLPRVRVR